MRPHWCLVFLTLYPWSSFGQLPAVSTEDIQPLTLPDSRSQRNKTSFPFQSSSTTTTPSVLKDKQTNRYNAEEKLPLPQFQFQERPSLPSFTNTLDGMNNRDRNRERLQQSQLNTFDGDRNFRFNPPQQLDANLPRFTTTGRGDRFRLQHEQEDNFVRYPLEGSTGGSNLVPGNDFSSGNPGGGSRLSFQDGFGSFSGINKPSVSVNPNSPFGNFVPGGGIVPPRSSGILKEPRYFVVAGRIVRPGQIYQVLVTIFQTQSQPHPIDVRASLLRNGVDIGSQVKTCHPNILETLMIAVPKTSVEGNYRLRVEGNDNGLIGGTAFVNETELRFSQRSMTIFIQTDKPKYKQSQTVRFRAIPVNTRLRAFGDAVDVYMLDPKANVVRRWLSRQSNYGAVSLNYTLSDQPVYGNWTIRVQALQQIEEKTFYVEEYYQPRFEVNVTMPAFFFDTEEFLAGTVIGNFTSGAPVRGNLTLKASVRPIYARSYQSLPGNFQDHPAIQQFIPDFSGFYEFQFPMWEIERAYGQLNNIEVTVEAKIGEYFWNTVVEGYSNARIYNSTLRLQFLGGSPQVFKPGMAFTAYLAISYQDGSPINLYRLWKSEMEVQAEVLMHSRGTRRLDLRRVSMLPDSPGIWKVVFNLKQELSAGYNRPRETAQIINEVQSLRIQASFSNKYRETAQAELLAVAHFSPKNRHIRVSSSTANPKVGEYIVLHVRTNFYMDRFTFLVSSKGVVLLSGTENMDSTIKTFAIPVNPEMAPAATIVVYHVSKHNEVVADALTYPVNGLSRNNFTVQINNKKEKTNNFVEVIIRGKPGSYVGLSGIDAAFYSIQAGNEISYTEVLSKMLNFDEDSNGTLVHKWISREGLPDEVVYFASHSYGIDANRTFEFSGLVVFSDVSLPRRPETCNETAGWYPCFTGGLCYLMENKCNGVRECPDGTDESGCPLYNQTELLEFKLKRFNSLERLFENVWLWKDINIGPHGHFIFNLPVPERPAMWMISAIGVSPSSGFGLLTSPIKYSGVRPLFINVEMPDKCRQGEQIGIRATIFNYVQKDIEVMVILADSRDYKFIHVEAEGIARHYNPRTSFGEHQHLIWIPAQGTAQVHFPIVAARIGKIQITIKAISQIARDQVTRSLVVGPDGAPQYRHISVLLDLSNRAYVLQFMHVNVTESPIIPRDPDRYYVYSSNIAEISVVGDVIGPTFPTMPVNATSLLGGKPIDSAEQNMFSFAANLYTLMYLRLTNQRNRITFREAFHHLNIFFQRQLSFQNEDGSFSLFRSDWNHSSPSVWVTAYCARVFAEASFNEWENFLYIDTNVISKAVDWVLRHQTFQGSFYEITSYSNRRLNDSRMDDSWYYTSPNVTLTAHVLIALHTVKDLPGAVGPRLADARQRAIQYLETKVDERKNSMQPYEAVLVAYALMLSKSSKADQAFIIVSGHAKFEGGYAYWGREPVPLPSYILENNKPFLLPRLPYNYDSENIETTAYALMIYASRQEIRVESIVKWLNSQRQYNGGWASTQDTAAAYRALIDYTLRQKIRNVTELTVTVEAAAIPDIARTFHVNAANLAQQQSISFENAYGTVSVEAKGAGYAILQMQVQYGVDRERFVTKPPMQAFYLNPQFSTKGRNASLIEYFSCQSWTLLEESERSGMTVLEVNIPTGYFIHQPILDVYVRSGMVPTLKGARYMVDKVVFHFEYLERNPTCINFTVERWFPVANMTRYMQVRVYDYYAPERFNEIVYDALEAYSLDICQVCGSYQCPYCPIFAGGPFSTYPTFSVISATFIVFIIFTHVSDT